jgi:hypothetical protein
VTIIRDSDYGPQSEIKQHGSVWLDIITGMRGVQGGDCALSSLRGVCRHKGASLAEANWILKELLSMKDAGLFSLEDSRRQSAEQQLCRKLWEMGSGKIEIRRSRLRSGRTADRAKTRKLWEVGY